MIRFYFHPTPNPAKVALFLEEAGLPYEVIPVDTSKGEQHAPAFRAINPNGKVPAIVDTDGPGGKDVRVFDSTAILLYLAEKTGQLLGKPEDRSELHSWLLFIASGLGPFSGQAVHFQLCVQRRLACSAGERPAGARVRSPVVWIAGWRETKTLKPIDNVSLGETTSRRAVMKVNANVASKMRSPEGRARNWRAKAAWGAEI